MEGLACSRPGWPGLELGWGKVSLPMALGALWSLPPNHPRILAVLTFISANLFCGLLLNPCCSLNLLVGLQRSPWALNPKAPLGFSCSPGGSGGAGVEFVSGWWTDLSNVSNINSSDLAGWERAYGEAECIKLPFNSLHFHPLKCCLACLHCCSLWNFSCF